ncbi:MAG: divergent polysaccharide deacetylase family protein [Alphaproteobacteria bacterium]|nr:divergent polysaccharide deacetylase family protein [Alphaproteobacteria bacterium]
MKQPFKAPKLSLPFSKRSAGDGLNGPSEGVDEDQDEDKDAFAFAPRTGESDALKRRLPWIAVIGGYAATAAALGGVAAYLILSADQIEQEMIEARPKAEVAGDRIVVRRVGETAGGETARGDTADAESQVEAALEAAAEAAKEAVSAVSDPDPAISSADPVQLDAAADRPLADVPATDAASDIIDDPPIPDLFADTLAPHPDPGLIVESEVGPLPVIGEDGRRAWQVYSRPSNPLETRPKIAVVVTDLGVNARRVEAAIALPGPITLAFAPYARKVGDWIEQARADGHEVMLTLPLEPADFPRSDPGPFALMSGFDADQNVRRLHWVLSRATGYVGLVSYQGGAFAANAQAVRPVFNDLKTRGLIYLDGRQASASTTPRIARSVGVPVSQADIVVDGSFGRAHVLQRLKLAESLASANGSVIVLAKPFPMTLERLRIWSEDLDANGYALIPASAVISERFAS